VTRRIATRARGEDRGAYGEISERIATVVLMIRYYTEY